MSSGLLRPSLVSKLGRRTSRRAKGRATRARGEDPLASMTGGELLRGSRGFAEPANNRFERARYPRRVASIGRECRAAQPDRWHRCFAKMDTEIRILFNCIHEEVVQLFYRWKMFRQLFGSGEENLNLLNQSGSNVFALLQGLIIENAFLTVCRLTDPERTGSYQNLA